MSKQDRYWDSSTFLAYFKEEENRVELCQAVIEAAYAGKVRIITSTIAFCEVVYIKGKEKLTQDIEEDLRAFFEYDFIVPVDVNRAVAEYARELMWKHTHLRAYDALHLSTACHAGVTIIDSFDDDFLKLDGEFSGFDGSAIRIRHPNLPFQFKIDYPASSE